MSSQPLYRKSYSVLATSKRPRDGSIAYLFELPRAALTPAIAPVPPADSRREGETQSALQLPGTSVARLAPEIWRAAHDRGRKTWALVDISYEEFAAHAEAMGNSEPPSHAADLYLTIACRLGRYAAVQVLEEEYIARTRSLIQTIVRDSWGVDDVLQDLRRRLLAGPAAKVTCYRGTGPLGSWIRAIALNVARDHLRADGARRRREESHAYALSCGALELPSPDDDMTRCVLRNGGAQACFAAVRRAFQSLQRRERELLNDYYFRRLSIDALSPLYLVNRATVARRIRRSTQEVGRQVRKQLAVLYPREDLRTLDALALASCRHLIADAAGLFEVPAPDCPSARPALRHPSGERTGS